MKVTIHLLSILLFSLSLQAQIANSSLKPAQNNEASTIKNVIETSYFNGAFNALDTASMTKGFHADFAIFSPEKNDLLAKYPIAEWIAAIEKRKSAAGFDATKREWKGEIKAIDITKKAAMAKIELQRNDKLRFTDYMLLYKFASGWKIVGKVYADHASKEIKKNPDDDKAIREMFIKNYFNGSFNGLDTVAMAKGFHPDFAMYSIGSGDLMGKYPINKWIESIEKRKAAASFNPENFKRDCEVKSLDITDNSAVAKIELRRVGVTPTIDYLLVLKFESGWKIVGKIFS